MASPADDETAHNHSFSKVYQFKITLRGVVPAVWRRIQVLEDSTFDNLNFAIQNAMNWSGFHMHEFCVVTSSGENVKIGRPAYYEHSLLASLMETLEIVDEETVPISTYFTESESSVVFVYDFEDCWEHSIVLEKVLPASAKIQYPKCIGGKRICPLEDCGGAREYQELLNILSNREHPEYESRKEWLVTHGYKDQLTPNKFHYTEVVFYPSYVLS